MAKKIKIGFLTERMLLGFGVDLVVHKTADYLVRQGFEVAVFCLRADKTFRDQGYKIIELKADLATNPIQKQRRIKRLLANLDQEPIDLWIVETYPFYGATEILSAPVLVVDHGVSSARDFALWKQAGFAYIKQERDLRHFPKADAIVCISRFVRSLTPKILRSKQTIIYNGADNYPQPTAEAVRTFRTEMGIRAEDQVLLYVGRLNHAEQPYKGVRELVKTFQAFREKHGNLKLMMAGFGKAEDQEELERAGVIVLLKPKAERLALALAAADVYVSASRWEGFNLPLTEAAWFKKPAVVYDIGAHREVLGQGAGFLVKSRQEFIQKIERLITRPKLAQCLGSKAGRNARRFNWEAAGQQYLQIVQQLLVKEKPAKELRQSLPDCTQGLVDIIVVNYNGKQYLRKLLPSIRQQSYSKIAVTVVDNASSDGSVDYVQKNYPEVNLLTQDKNLFFCRANNLAAASTRGEYILFLNNDTRLDQDAVAELVAAMEQRGPYLLAAAAPKMYFNERQKKKQGLKSYQEAGRIIDAAGLGFNNHFSPYNPGHGQMDIGQFDEREWTDGVSFGAALVRRLVFEQTVGDLDDSYKMYFEDADWSLRARLQGYRMVLAPKALVYHEHSATATKLGRKWKSFLIYRNYVRTVIKNLQFGNMLRILARLKLETFSRVFKEKNGLRLSVSGFIKIWLGVFGVLPRLSWHRFQINQRRCRNDQSLISREFLRKAKSQ